MKTTISRNAFGVTAVKNQRVTETAPVVTALSTLGGFRISAPATRAMRVSPGDYIKFYSNVSNIDTAIESKHELFIALCNEQGVDPESDEAAIMMHKAYDTYFVAKGFQMFNSHGASIEVPERLSYKDKMFIVKENYQDMLEAALAENSGIEDDVREVLSSDDVEEEKKMELLTAFVVRKTNKFSGCKTANPSGQTGVGSVLNFSNADVWKNLKSDLSEEEQLSINRVFTLDIENAETITDNNGYQDIEVTIYPLIFKEDKAPMRRGEGDDTEAEE